MTLIDERVDAAVRALYPWYDTWPEEDQKIAQQTVRRALEASDEVMFADESVARCYPFVYSFLKRRGLLPVGKEVQSLVGYVVTGLRGGYKDVG